MDPKNRNDLGRPDKAKSLPRGHPCYQDLGPRSGEGEPTHLTKATRAHMGHVALCPLKSGGARIPTERSWWAPQHCTETRSVFTGSRKLARETVRAALHWLPPTLKYGGLNIIVDAALGGGPFREGPSENRPGRGVRHKSKGTGHPPLSGGGLPRGEPLPPSSLCQPDVRNVGILFGHAPLVQQVPERQQRQKQVRSLEGAEGDFCGQIEESAPTPDN